jgi:hypothetical protein
VDTRNVALDRGYGHEKCGCGQAGADTINVALDRGLWTPAMWLWTGDCGHEKCGSGPVRVDTSNVALDRRV